jgi:hypothetical protein
MRWEYRILDSKEAEGGGFLKSKSNEDVQAYLNGLGAKGWEIVDLDFRQSQIGTIGATSFLGLAKRPRP